MRLSRASYRGVDRRSAPRPARQQLRPPQLAIAAAAVTVVWGMIMAGPPLPWLSPGLEGLLALATAAAAGIGGALWLVRWRLAGDAPAARAGVAWIVHGVLTVGLGQVFLPVLLPSMAVPLGLVAASQVSVIGLLAIAAWTPRVHTGVRPTRLLAAVGAGIVMVTTLLATAAPPARLLAVSPASSGPPFAGVAAFGALTVSLWTALTAVQALRWSREREPVAGWTAIVAGGMALAGLASLSETAAGGTELVRLTALLVGLAGAARAVQTSVETDRERAHRVVATARAAQDRVRLVHAQQQERAHEAANALCAIDVAIRVLQRHRHQVDPETRSELHDAITGEIDRLRQLMSEPVEPTDQHDDDQRYDVRDVVRRQVAIARAQGLEVEAKASDSALPVVGNPDDLAQVLANLLGNVRKHAPGASATVTAETAGDHVHVRVRDTGPGIPTVLQGHVFERAVRGGAQSGSGSGLGLYVSQQLVEAQGGSLSAESPPGGGAEFRLRLPAAPSLARVTSLPAPRQQAAAGSSNPSSQAS